jgi:hypothetical protein
MPRAVVSRCWQMTLGLLLMVLCGCVSPVSSQHASGLSKTRGETVLRNEPKITVRTIKKWNPVWWFGNADDPEPPEWYKPDDPSRGRKWLMRNPLHNFTFYVIGVADKPFDRVGRHPEDVFNSEGGWNFATARYRHWRFPFISYTHGRFATYWGWRERGNFGVKFTFRRPVAKPEAAITTTAPKVTDEPTSTD